MNYECRYYDPESLGGQNGVTGRRGGEYNAFINTMYCIANEARVAVNFAISFEGYGLLRRDAGYGE